MRIRIFLLAPAVSAARLAPPRRQSRRRPSILQSNELWYVSDQHFTRGLFTRLNMSGCYSMRKTAGNRFTFNTNPRFTPGLSSFTMTELCSAAASLSTKRNDGPGKFTWDIVE
jgi:hypothetical protein